MKIAHQVCRNQQSFNDGNQQPRNREDEKSENSEISVNSERLWNPNIQQNQENEESNERSNLINRNNRQSSANANNDNENLNRDTESENESDRETGETGEGLFLGEFTKSRLCKF